MYMTVQYQANKADEARHPSQTAVIFAVLSKRREHCLDETRHHDDLTILDAFCRLLPSNGPVGNNISRN